MSIRLKMLLALLLVACLGLQAGWVRGAMAAGESGSPPTAPAAVSEAASPSARPDDCERLVKLFDQQREQMASDLGRVKREMAALREELSRPGMRDVVAGIGYIFGLAGIVLFFKSRGTRRENGEGGRGN